jgi:hypothetical protein
MLRTRLLPTLSCLVFLGQTSCMTSSKVIDGPDGTPHQLIKCSSIEQCYKKAKTICGGPYKIVNTSNEVFGSEIGTSTTTNLLVKCQE